MFGMGSKPGKGVSKEEALKRSYLDILGRHLRHIFGVSIIYLLATFPFFGAFAYLANAYFTSENLLAMIQAFLSGESFFLPIIPFLPLMLIGPATAGLCFITRNYAKQEHVFLWSDFWEQARKNFGYALLTSVFSVLIGYLLVQALIFYNSFFIANGLPLGVLYTLFSVIAVLFITMNLYAYPILVTFRMKYKVVIKNAWSFTLMKLPQNLCVLAFLLLINGGIFYISFFVVYMQFIWYIITAIFLTGFTSYTANYYIWGVLDKYIVQYVTKKDDSDRIFSDEQHKEEDIWDAFDRANQESDFDETI